MHKIALYGQPGAGKSTFCRLLSTEFTRHDLPTLTLRLGAPLYELQAIIHAVAGRPLLNSVDQDGLLLNSLGSHLRRINPDALTDAFAVRVHEATRRYPGSVVICDDMRAPDVRAVVELGFTLVQITAPNALRAARKDSRGDLSAGQDDHPTEAPVQCVPDYVIRNDSDLNNLRELASGLVKMVIE